LKKIQNQQGETKKERLSRKTIQTGDSKAFLPRKNAHQRKKKEEKTTTTPGKGNCPGEKETAVLKQSAIFIEGRPS